MLQVDTGLQKLIDGWNMGHVVDFSPTWFVQVRIFFVYWSFRFLCLIVTCAFASVHRAAKMLNIIGHSANPRLGREESRGVTHRYSGVAFKKLQAAHQLAIGGNIFKDVMRTHMLKAKSTTMVALSCCLS